MGISAEVVLVGVNNCLAETTASHSSIHLRHHSVICSWPSAGDLCMWLPKEKRNSGTAGKVEKQQHQLRERGKSNKTNYESLPGRVNEPGSGTCSVVTLQKPDNNRGIN